MQDSPGLLCLEPAECLRLLDTVRIGRIVYTDRALPAVLPVTFVVRGGDLMIRTGPERRLAAATDTVVAFEADEFDDAGRRGWSVTAVGRAIAVTDPAERAEISALPLPAWAPAAQSTYLRIEIELLNGHRIESIEAPETAPCTDGTGPAAEPS
ncbi:MAG: pyridoxamine 5'-phosphate oxidase family protein [Streptosporangiales bacterium]|nr:pyridoxamine 5'-phosphate oxidase family protein [Streptosporangiales bacterium]